MEQMDNLKKKVRQLGKYLSEIRESLDDGDCAEYDILAKAEPLVKEINRVLREVTKTLDKREKV